ncbi:hypothetical protein [Pseudoblastomonas halimionae]|uniref:Uncharacterized protein n=1 Tax=Alteriqipengyuania halimionae TaxID=1926630 RepID=A0A6I4U8W7_9SPHN|nr:hypothetical protein [Alteriqipengyuania halimionae]MXP10727.1 hypothetical protein [Alteriqipengyuania halimionae]
MKKLIAAASAATFALSLAACGSDSATDDEVVGDTVEEPADEALSDIPEETPVAVEPAPAATEVPESRRQSLEESGDRAEAAADDIEAALEAEFGQAEDARDAEAQ